MLALCGVLLVREARTGGFPRARGAVGRGAPATGRGFAWVSAGDAGQRRADHHDRLHPQLHAVLRARGARLQVGRGPARPGVARAWLVDAAIGFAIAAPVYWMFTQLLAINLPGLTATGWL